MRGRGCHARGANYNQRDTNFRSPMEVISPQDASGSTNESIFACVVYELVWNTGSLMVEMVE
jgi:hypothetical protein